MAEIPFFVYSLSDELTLCDYEANMEVSLSRIKERSIKEAREFNYYLPDYVYRNRFEYELKQTEKSNSLSEYLINGLTFLAKKYLSLHNGKLYVNKDLHEEWMDITHICPPLIICSAYFLKDFEQADNKKKFFEKRLLNQFNETAQRPPLMYDLENWVKREGRLFDLHIHLNGSSETDVLWWSQIGNVDIWTNEIRIAFYKNIVRQQFEQEEWADINRITARIRRGKELIIETYRNDIVNDTIFERISNLYHPYKDYPVLAKAAYYNLLMLNKIHNGCERTARQFHQLLLIEGTIHRLVVQQKKQKGFHQFQMITENDIRWRQESQNYRQRFEQLTTDVNFCFLEYLEGRFSPKLTQKANRSLIKKIADDFIFVRDKISENFNIFPQLGLIAHFIKRKENIQNEQERHCLLRKDVRDKSIALLATQRYLCTNKETKSKINICGIDAAANEMDAGPEVFAPTFRWLRHYWQGNKDLRITFHAGEDFVHILSGLRMMYEAVEFLDMQQGDRIGHGTAAGINPKLWVERVGDSIYIQVGEWLDDLLITYKLIESPQNPYMELRSKLPTIHHIIEELTLYIYGEVLGIEILYKCWQCRKYEPDVYLKEKTVFQKETEENENKIIKLISNPKVKEYYDKYHYDKEFKRKYCELISIPLCKGLFSMEELSKIQNLVLHKLAIKNIALEVPISSNLCISFYRDLDEHHIGRWLEGHSEGNLLIPPLVLGSDDPGIFMTNIYIEYARLMTYLEQKGYNFVERINIIEEINRTSKYYAFL